MEVPHSDAHEARNVLWDAIGTQLTLSSYGSPRPLVAGKWEVEGILGRGGYGLVCVARDRTLPRRVAIKLFPRDPQGSSFIREARSLALLDHPGIVKIIDVGEGEVMCGEHSLPCGWIVMQLVEGDTLGSWVQRARPRLDQVLDVVAAVGRAIAHAHDQGVLHRDLKPTNIMVDAWGRPHVIDFGLAIAPAPWVPSDDPSPARDALGTRVTSTGFVHGTPRYMSLEAVDGRYSASSDQFALAVVAWEALTGTHPQDAGNARYDAKTTDGDLWTRVEPVLRRGMSSMPAERYGSMRSFCDALESARRTPRRLRWAVALVAVVCTALSVAYWAGSRASPDDPEDKAMVGAAAQRCGGLEDWSGHWGLTGKIIWTEYSNQLEQIRPMTLDVTVLDGCDLQLEMSKFLPAGPNRPDGFLSATTKVAPRQLSEGSWSLAYDLAFPGDRKTYGQAERHGFALTLDHTPDGSARVRGAFQKEQVRSGLVLRKGWLLGRRVGSPTLAEVESHEYPCDARCRVQCAGEDAVRACIERDCAPYREPLSDPCGPPSEGFVTPLRTRAERRHFRKGTRFGAVNAGKAGDCEANAIRVAGRWWLWRGSEESPELFRIDVVPYGCQLQATVRPSGSETDVTMKGEITEMGIWYLARDPRKPVDPETLILAGTGPAFGLDMTKPGQPLRGFRQ